MIKHSLRSVCDNQTVVSNTMIRLHNPNEDAQGLSATIKAHNLTMIPEEDVKYKHIAFMSNQDDCLP